MAWQTDLSRCLETNGAEVARTGDHRNAVVIDNLTLLQNKCLPAHQMSNWVHAGQRRRFIAWWLGPTVHFPHLRNIFLSTTPSITNFTGYAMIAFFVPPSPKSSRHKVLLGPCEFLWESPIWYWKLFLCGGLNYQGQSLDHRSHENQQLLVGASTSRHLDSGTLSSLSENSLKIKFLTHVWCEFQLFFQEPPEQLKTLMVGFIIWFR